jgi:Flp pilus assembly protein TadD
VTVPSVFAGAALAFLLLGFPGRAAADRASARALVELRHLERAIAEDPDYLPAYDSATGLWLRNGHFQPLIERLARVTLRHPRYASGWYALGFAYRRTSRHDLAILCYQAYLELRPNEPDPYFGIAMSHLELGNDEAAATALERYLELERRPARAEFTAEARRELARLREAAHIDDPAELAERIGTQLRALAAAARRLF